MEITQSPLCHRCLIAGGALVLPHLPCVVLMALVPASAVVLGTVVGVLPVIAGSLTCALIWRARDAVGFSSGMTVGLMVAVVLSGVVLTSTHSVNASAREPRLDDSTLAALSRVIDCRSR